MKRLFRKLFPRRPGFVTVTIVPDISDFKLAIAGAVAAIAGEGPEWTEVGRTDSGARVYVKPRAAR